MWLTLQWAALEMKELWLLWYEKCAVIRQIFHYYKNILTHSGQAFSLYPSPLVSLFLVCLSIAHTHSLIDIHHHWPLSASSKRSRYFSIPNMWAVTGLINNKAYGAYASRIPPRVLYHLLRATVRGRCEINRGIYTSPLVSPGGHHLTDRIRHHSSHPRIREQGEGAAGYCRCPRKLLRNQSSH